MAKASLDVAVLRGRPVSLHLQTGSQPWRVTYTEACSWTQIPARSSLNNDVSRVSPALVEQEADHRFIDGAEVYGRLSCHEGPKRSWTQPNLVLNP